MKKYIIILGFAIFSINASISAQDCNSYYPLEDGTEVEIKNYDHKDKLTGSSIQKITGKQGDDNNLTITVDHQSFDKKGELLMDGELIMRCENGIFYMDMRNMLDNSALAAYENMEVEVDATDMTFPFDMQVGSTLADASISIKIKSESVTVMTMTVWITDRKIEAEESITTPAGTFSCYKMSYNIETKMIMKVQAKAVQWIAENIGMVKSETYNKKGKLQGYSVLTGLK
jgi:hypothetical protein